MAPDVEFLPKPYRPGTLAGACARCSARKDAAS
jgi:hypothetical protein